MASLLEDLLNPVGDASFCGEDGSYEPEFEAARAEADKSSENDFALIADNSRKFLTKKSKDMRALGYLVLASAMKEGPSSSAQVVQAYCRLAMEHWEDIHPKRPAARMNALKWLNGERTLSLLGSLSPQGDYETLQAASDALEQLRAFCEQRFPEGPPSFGGFAKQFREWAAKNKPNETPAGSTAVSASSSASGVSAQSAAAPAAIASADDCVVAVQNAAFFLLEENSANSLPYRLMRSLKWEPIRATPQNDNGRSLVPAPYPATLDAFRNLFQQRQWRDLAQSGEEAFSGDGMIFWLDLQRYLCSALNGLGGDHADCAQAVVSELALLLRRVPDLPGLEFDDGTPFADAMTREWIQSEVKTALGGSAAPAAVKKKGDVGEEQKQADALLAAGKLDQALQVLRTGLANDSSEKNSFERKLLMAEMCYKGGKHQVARALLDDLAGFMRRFRLDGWDPELCAAVYLLTQKVYLSLAEAAEDEQKLLYRSKALEAHSQISKLDPVLAINSDFK